MRTRLNLEKSETRKTKSGSRAQLGSQVSGEYVNKGMSPGGGNRRITVLLPGAEP